MARIGQVQRENMFALTAEVIDHGEMIAQMYPLLGDFTQVPFKELVAFCQLRSVNPDHVWKAVLALTAFDLKCPDQETVEAFAAAKETLAAGQGKTHQDSWPRWYTSFYYRTPPQALPDTLSMTLDASA